MTKKDIPQEILDEVLSPGYCAFETGVKMLPTGEAYVTNLVIAPNVKGKMFEWWFGSCLNDTSQYKFWHPDHTTFEWDKDKKEGTCVGATHFSAEYLGDQLVPMAIHFFDPCEIFTKEQLDEAGVTACICAEIGSGDMNFGMFIHVVRDTAIGCDIRTRSWMNGATMEMALDSNRHNMEEMTNLAQFLPCLYNLCHK